MKTLATATAVPLEDVIREGFRSGHPEALLRSKQLREKYLDSAANYAAAATKLLDAARAARRRARDIDEIVAAEQAHWTPRVVRGAEGVPTPETVVKNRRRSQNPILYLHRNGRITDGQKWAADMIARVFEEASRDAASRISNLEASLGGTPRNSGRKASMMPADVAIEHLLVYRPWTEAMHRSPTLSLPLIFAVVVDCHPLNQVREMFHMKHDTLIEQIKGGLDLYIEFDSRTSSDERDRLWETEKTS